jgi:hypothetical protein
MIHPDHLIFNPGDHRGTRRKTSFQLVSPVVAASSMGVANIYELVGNRFVAVETGAGGGSTLSDGEAKEMIS